MLNTLSIISGKGGSGKTSLAILLSQLFASFGRKVLLVDCDMSTHGATYFFEEMLSQKEKYYTVSNILYGNTNIKQPNLEILRVSPRIGFVPSRIDFSSKKKPGETTDSAKLQSFLSEIEQQGYNIVIFDCQAGYSIETEAAVKISETNLAVIEADAISAIALRVLYVQLSEELDNGRTYQVFNKISKEEQEIYSKLTHGTLFTNITPILFDWNLRKAFVTNELPEINSSNSSLATSVYELAIVLFPQYKDDLRKFILDIKQERISSLEKELKNIQINSKNESLKKIGRIIFPLFTGLTGLMLFFIMVFPFKFFDEFEKETLIILVAMFSFSVVGSILSPLFKSNQDDKHKKMMLKIEKERLEEETPQLKLKLKRGEMISNEEGYKNNLKDIMERLALKNPRLQPLEAAISDVFKVYNRYEASMLELMKDEFLDRHKIAAALCCSVLKVKPINLPVYPTAIEKSANELCAFLLGMQVIQDWWSAKQKERNISAEEKKIYSQEIQYPDPREKYPEMFANLFKEEETFDHFDIDQRQKFEKRLIFLISHAYFIIEEYSFEFIKNELISETQAAKSLS